MSAADYSFARPGGAALRAAGITDVGRYLAPLGDGRALEAAEYADLKAHGINVWVNREGAATSMLGGYATGLYHGQTAADNLRRLGLDPKTTVVYASADFDAQPAQFPVMDAYMDGFTAGLGSSPDWTGTYGSMPWINHCRATGKAKWFWQSASTSFTHGQTGFVHIQQTTLPSLAGTDHNYLHAADYGQIGTNPNPITPEEDMSYSIAPLDDGGIYLVSLVTGLRVHITAPYHVTLLQRLKKNDSNDTMLRAEVDICNSYLTQINPAPTVPALTDTQLQALEQALGTELSNVGLTLTQAQVDAIAGASATAVRTVFTDNPLK